MAADNLNKRLQEETTCPLCLDFFAEPVMLECGHNFCRGCALKCWKLPATRTALCPQCRKPIRQRSLRANLQLANIVDIAKQLEERAAKEAVAGHVCESHQEPLKFFCRDDEAPICVVCERSKGHREHRVVPAEEAAEEYKVQIHTSLANLRMTKEELLALKEKARKQSQDLLNSIARERQRTAAAFRFIRQFLEEEENRLLAQMEELDEEIARKRDEDVASLSEELSSLEKTIREMEEACEKPPGQLLKNVPGMLQRGEPKAKCADLLPFPPALKWRIWDFWDVNPALQQVAKTFKDALKSEFLQDKETVTLEPRTAHPRLLISEDGKSLTLADQERSLPDSMQRFVHHGGVLGSKGFRSGRHCWDVDVGKEEGWAIGVSGRRFHNESLGPEGGVWAIGKWDRHYCAVIPPHNPPLPLSEEPKKIRVFLNCTGHQVAFFDADTAALLYTFTLPVYRLSLYYPFLCLREKCRLRLDP